MKEYCLGMYEKAMPLHLTWEEKLKKCKEFGFDWVEFSVDETDEKLARLDWTKEQRDDLKAIMNSEGVYCRTMCLSGHRRYPLGSENPEKGKKSMEIMKKAIDLAYDLGIRIIQVAGYDTVDEESNEKTKNNFISNIEIATKWAASKGVILAFETMRNDFMNTVEKAMNIVDLVNSPYLQIYPDVANLVYELDGTETTVSEDLMKGKGHIVAVHVKETNKNHERRIPFGSGNDYTQYVKHMKVLKDMGVRMFMAEFWDKGGDYEAICTHAANFLRERLDIAFDDSKDEIKNILK